MQKPGETLRYIHAEIVNLYNVVLNKATYNLEVGCGLLSLIVNLMVGECYNTGPV